MQVIPALQYISGLLRVGFKDQLLNCVVKYVLIRTKHIEMYNSYLTPKASVKQAILVIGEYISRHTTDNSAAKLSTVSCIGTLKGSDSMQLFI